MEPIFETFLETISAIRSPLMYWCFIFLLFSFVIYFLVNNNKLLFKFSKQIISSLSNNALFKTIRLLIILSLSFLFVILLLLISAPILLSYMENSFTQPKKEPFQNVDSSLIRKYNEEMKANKLLLNNKKKQIIKYYEAGVVSKINPLVKEVYGRPVKDGDELQGMVVATYFANRDYKKAAIAVLERDKNKPIYDYSLKNDIAQCIRSYTIKNGLKSGLELTEYLQNKYGKKLVSVFWTVLPINFIRTMSDGIYDPDNINLIPDTNFKYISHLIELYPNDKFIDHALYALHRFDKLIQLFPASPIKNIYLFGAGDNIIDLLRNKYSTYNESHDDYYMLNLLNNYAIQANGLLINKAISYFSEYIAITKESPQLDDAYYWLSWLTAQNKQLTEAIYYLTKLHPRNLFDSNSHSVELLNSLLRKLPADTQSIYIDRIEKIKIDYAKKDRIDYLTAIMQPAAALKIILSENSLQNDTMVNLIVKNHFERNSDLKGCQNLYNLFKAQLSGTILYDINNIINCDTVSPIVIKKVLFLKNNLKYRKLCNQTIELLLKKNASDSIKEYLAYLQICNLKVISPDKVENYANSYINSFKLSPLADDVLAELVYVQAHIFQNLYKAEYYYGMLMQNYSKRNAVDNASYWLALGYHYSDLEDHINLAKKRYIYIMTTFPLTRFARYSLKNMIDLNKNPE